ncbi:MAG TPA: autotransporter-associated beta strand repeat-containing protein, partial [Roseimicrobium sp.]|nr:autotransporter-associated beta strand repeat-containing protein [Roseimicrobium sp.]
TLRYTGATNSTTNRVVDLAGAATGTAFTAVTIQNNGTGTLKFTSAFTATGTSTTARQLTLSGSNTGINEISGLTDASNAVTNLIKDGIGTWAITGASTHSGTTAVNAGTLLANNATGSATGTGNVSVTSTSRLGGNGFIGSDTATQNISVVSTAFLNVGNTGDIVGQSLNLSTSGVGVISLSGTIEFDIFGNSGGVNSLVNNDILILDSDTSIQITGTLQLTDTTASSTCWEIGDAWQLFDWLNVGATTKVSGNFDNLVLPALAAGLQWDTSNLYTTGFISVAAVPEPGRVMLLGVALGAMMLRRVRGRQRQSV